MDVGRIGRRRLALLVAVAMAMVVAPGCWLQIGAGPGHTRSQAFDGGLTAENVDTLHELWSVEVPGSLSEPMVSDGRVFVASTDAYSAAVWALDARTGTSLWITGLVDVPPVAGAAVGATPVTFVGDQLSSGFFGFVPMAPGRPPGPACVLGATALDPATGASSPRGFGWPAPAVSVGPVVARVVLTVASTQPCATSSTLTLEVTGSPGGGWSTTIPGPFTGAFVPALTSDRVLLTHGPSVDSYALDCTEDCLRWTRTLSPEPLDPVVDGTGPVLVRTGGALLALDQADGATLWTAPLAGTLGREVAVADGTVYVASVDPTGGGGVVQAFDVDGCGAATCEPRWEGSFDGTAVGAPVVGGGVVYVPDGNSVVAFDAAGCGAATCSPLADVDVSGTGRLVLSNGRLFLAGTGRLTALAAG
jgi:outer membrane protein assembly factor BamB